MMLNVPDSEPGFQHQAERGRGPLPGHYVFVDILPGRLPADSRQLPRAAELLRERTGHPTREELYTPLCHKASKSPLRPDRQFIPIRICKVKPPPAGEFEDLFDDFAAGLQHHFKRMFQFVAVEHDQRAAGGGVGGLVGLVESAVEPRVLK